MLSWDVNNGVSHLCLLMLLKCDEFYERGIMPSSMNIYKNRHLLLFGNDDLGYFCKSFI